ncbi:hypothetical protein OAT84_01965 [Gammaproteobacteria bacterium]|nr:hypothetical protein [Gammaproteobacteria bacterium]
MSNIPNSDKEICQSIVGKIADLAVLKLTDEEKLIYKADFEALIEMFHALDDIEVSQGQTDTQLIDIDQCRNDEIDTQRPDLEKASHYFNTESQLFDVPQLFKDAND